MNWSSHQVLEKSSILLLIGILITVAIGGIVAGFFTQFYLRNYKPGFFREYAYMIMGAFDGASLCALFIMTFAVFGAAGASKPFPQWWGNNVAGNYDLCPTSE